MAKAGKGHDMFVGGLLDDTFGPFVFFGYGGIYMEVFKDVQCVLCPSIRAEVERKMANLMARFPEIKELDMNPIWVFPEHFGSMALDSRLRIER